MIIDAHIHLFEQAFVGMGGGSAEKLAGDLYAQGIQRAWLFTIGGFFGDPRPHNDVLVAAARAFPDLFIPFCTVNPTHGQVALDELRRCVDELGMAGLKLHPWCQAFSVVGDYMRPIMEACAERAVPVVFHDGSPPYTETPEIAHLAALFPDCTVILGHSGLRDQWRNALQAAQRHPNICLCTCNACYVGLKEMVRVLGPERVIFGSDAGFGSPSIISYELMKVRELLLEPEPLAQVLGANAARILEKHRAPF